MVSVVNQDDVAKDDFCPKVKLFHIFMPVMRGHRMMLPEQSLVDIPESLSY